MARRQSDRSNYYGFEHGNYLRTDVDVASARLDHDFNSSVSLRNQVRYGHYGRAVQITEAKIAGTVTPRQRRSKTSTSRATRSR